MRKFTSIHWVMALFIAAISLCSVLPGQHVRASEYSPVGVGGLFAAAEENDPYSCLQFPPPGLISATSGEPVVRFGVEPDSIRYQPVYNGNESSVYSHYTVDGNLSSAFKVRVQLKDQTQANVVRFATEKNNSMTLTDGGFWFPAEEIGQEDEYFFFHFEIFSSKTVEVDYTVSLYPSEDLTTEPMDSSERKAVFVTEEDLPVMPSLPRLRGELNTDVPYTFSIEPGFLRGKPAIVRLSFHDVDMNNLVVSGEGWQKHEYGDAYEYRIDRLTQDEITVNFKAAEQIGGRYGMELCDGEGIFVTGTGDGVLRFPANLSEDDQQALKALMEDNPESTELRNFIETGLYKKDINLNETTEKVAVKWNEEAPARVIHFRLNDDDRKVSTLNLNALKGLKRVELRGTNLKTLDLSGLTPYNLDLDDTPLKWGDVQLPKWTDEYHSLSGYTTIQLNPTVIKGAEIDLSEFAQEGASTFSWFEYNRSEGPKPVELTQTSPGKFILDGEIGQRFYCEIRNERYEDWIMRTTNLICTTSGEPVVRFKQEPGHIYYKPVFKGGESSIFSYYTIESIPPSAFKVRVQLKDQTQANDVRFVTSNNNSLTLTDGGFWLPAEEIRQEDEYFCINFGIVSSKAIEVDYTVSLYPSEDLTTEPMDSSERKVLFVASEDFPVMPSFPSLRGELNTVVPYTFSIEPGFLKDKPAIVLLYFHDVDLDNLLVSGKGWQKNEYFNRYEYRIDCLTQDQITVNLKATEQIGGRYHMELCDGEGIPVTGTRYAVLQFPANLSNDDQQALKAMQKANPESKELRDFIETGRYKKDIYLRETTERVAVRWNYETPARVSDLLLIDVDRKVSTLNLNALKGLEAVELQGTNLKTLDLSDLTLSRLGLINTPLKWSDVKLPKWTDEYHGLYGHTEIQLNPTIMKGAEIDLSEFAQVDTVASTFTWFEYKKSEADKRVELTQTSPGKFILDGEMGQRLYCEIKNERYGNWVLRTTVVTVGDPVIHFSQQDVMALEKLVKNANDPKLNEWWESKAWQESGMINGAQALWNNENPRRLTVLCIFQAELSETVDLSTLDRLETLSLMGNNNSKLTKLILPTEKASLRVLDVAWNKKLTSLDVTSYANLQHLDVSGTGLEACDVSKNTKLEVLNMRDTYIPGLEATAPEIAKQLEAYGVPNGNQTIDLDIFPALKKLIPNESMRYSDVTHPRQMEPLDFDLVKLISLPGDAYNPNYSSYGHTIDVSDSIKQEGVTAEPVWAVYNPVTQETDTLSHTGMTYTIGKELKPDVDVYAEVHNDLFPRWTLRYTTRVYTMDGDVNLDRTVDVKDVTSLISSMLGEWPSDRSFGWTQANTNHDEYYCDAADLVGLVNIILGKPVTKGEALRAAYIPQAELSVDERNNLYIDHEAPISAIYLEFAGATKELALTGDAARMTQSRSLQNDTLRIVAYSMDGKSIATGKQALMQLAPGMQLTKASFSDAKAVPLKLVGDYLPTANETIAPFDEVKAVYNYPNPASGTTTFCYSLSEDANSVEIELIASNGAVVARLQGLPTAQGRHEENVSLPFGNGVYFYRLVLNGKQIVATNTLIIK